MDLTNYLETFHRIQHTVGTQNKALLQAVLSLELQGKVAIYVQHLQNSAAKMKNQMESSFATYLWKRKTLGFFLLAYLFVYYVHATLSVKNNKASIGKKMVI